MNWLALQHGGTPVSSTLFTVYNRIQDAQRDALYRESMGPGDMVAGLLLPPFQRSFVWDQDRMTRFIDSARRGVPLGTYTVNDTFGLPGLKQEKDGKTWYEFDRWLLDGQQRLTTLEQFFNDGFPVHGMRWSEIGADERRVFLTSVMFPFVETRFRTYKEAAEYYDLMNFGGVAHKEEERALPSP